MTAPRVDIPGFEIGGPRRAELIQQDHDGLADPAEDAHLGIDVASRRRLFRCVNEVQDDVGVIAHVAHGLLAAPERPVGEPVPDLRQEPPERIAALLEAAQQPHAVAEPRRVPQHERVALRRLDQRVAFGDLGHVRGIPHLADVATQQRARERGLAHVRVRDEAQADGGGSGTRARLRFGHFIAPGRQPHWRPRLYPVRRPDPPPHRSPLRSGRSPRVRRCRETSARARAVRRFAWRARR